MSIEIQTSKKCFAFQRENTSLFEQRGGANTGSFRPLCIDHILEGIPGRPHQKTQLIICPAKGREYVGRPRLHSNSGGMHEAISDSEIAQPPTLYAKSKDQAFVVCSHGQS
jgi:hypothetical protein